jgi:hypothetical protein
LKIPLDGRGRKKKCIDFGIWQNIGDWESRDKNGKLRIRVFISNFIEVDL